MNWRSFRRLFILDTGHPDVDAEVDQELEFHFEATLAELKAKGLDETAARAEAERRFGSVARTRARLVAIDSAREDRTRRVEQAGAVWQDIRLAVRGLLREPGFTLAVAVMLALGIGANATMVGLVDRLMFRPPAHVADPHSLTQLTLKEVHPTFGTWMNTGLAWPDYVLTSRVPQFNGSAAFYTATLTQGRGTEAERVRISLTSAGFFPLLGVHPLLGRFYTEEEAKVGAGTPVIVLGEHYWQRRFGGQADVLGKSLLLGHTTFTVIGVAPRSFTGIELNAIDGWIPVGPGAPEMLGPSTEWAQTRHWQWVRVLARLKPGATKEGAETALTTLYRAEIASEREPSQTTGSFNLHSVLAGLGPEAPRSTPVAKWLAAVSFVVLLITCANVANLLLARGSRKQREIAVRLALGSRRRRLIAQLVLESLFLAVLGSGLALLVVQWGGSAIRTFLMPNIDWVDAPLDGRLLIVAAGATLLTVLLAGLMPALQISRPDLTESLKAGSPGAGRDPRHTRLRRTLLVTQTALSVVLLVGAGLFVRSLKNVTQLDLGFEPRRLMVVDLDLAEARVNRQVRAQLHSRLQQELRQLPGIESVSQAIAIPFWTRYSTGLRLPGRDSTPVLPTGNPTYNGVSPEFFATTGIKVVRGRSFSDADAERSAPVMIVNETMAKTFWPGEEAVGRCAIIGDDSLPCAEVVGVVEDTRREELRENPTMQYYVPLAQSARFGMSGDRNLFILARDNPEEMVEPIRRAIIQAAPEVAWANVRPMNSLLEPQLQPWRLGASMFGIFGLLALVVAAVGLYGVMAYSVTIRTREFGVRGALGATAGAIAGQVVREGLRLTLMGLAIGMAIALAASRFAAPLLFDTSPRDPGVLGMVAWVLLSVAVVASLLPALRAAHVAPADALRNE